MYYKIKERITKLWNSFFGGLERLIFGSEESQRRKKEINDLIDKTLHTERLKQAGRIGREKAKIEADKRLAAAKSPSGGANVGGFLDMLVGKNNFTPPTKKKKGKKNKDNQWDSYNPYK